MDNKQGGELPAERRHNHYFKNVSHLKTVDVYRVLSLFNVTDPCLQHAVKKLLVAGGRGAGKDIERDVREAVDGLNRFLQMRAEDDNARGKLRLSDLHTIAQVGVKDDPCAQLLPKLAGHLRVMTDSYARFHAGEQHPDVAVARKLIQEAEEARFVMPDNPALTGELVATLTGDGTGDETGAALPAIDLDAGARAAAHGVDLVTDQLSRDRARMPVFDKVELASPSDNELADQHARIVAVNGGKGMRPNG